MPLGRRSILAASAAAAVSSAAAQTRGSAGVTDADRRAREWLVAWDGQGIHRTATTGDEAGAAWLAGEAERIGGTVKIEEFALDRVDPLRGFVEFDGRIVSGLQMFDAPDTPRGGVEGLASRPEGEAFVALTELSPLAVYTPGFVQMRHLTKARAIVAVTRGGAPGLAPLNAEAFRAPYGPAILQVSSEAGETLAAAFARGAAFRVVTESRRVPAQARNIVLTIKGSDAARPKLVVMTPRSSWWQSTSERGGGLVCWLETLRALTAQPPACDVVFTANSGHELGHIGLDDFLARRPGWETAATWVHFGANIGAAGGRLSVVSENDDLRALASEALARAGISPPVLVPKGTLPNGETRDIHRAGGHYITLVGSNRLFHLPQDRYPAAVDTDAVARIAAAFASVVLALTR
jgi:hypothetical protein